MRYCARPPFALERLRKAGSELVYRCVKQHSEPGSELRDKRSAKGKTGEELHFTPLELIERIAALIPPPRTHRHRYFGVLAPNSPHRAEVTEMAQSIAVQTAQPIEVRSGPANTGAGEGAPGLSNPLPTQAEPAQPVPPKRPAHYLWAVLMARIYEVFPLLCPLCVAGRCESSPSSRTAATSGTYWNTSGQRQSRRAPPRHAGRRSGMTVMRKLVKPLSQPQTGMKRPKRCRTLSSISASVGELS